MDTTSQWMYLLCRGMFITCLTEEDEESVWFRGMMTTPSQRNATQRVSLLHIRLSLAVSE